MELIPADKIPIKTKTWIEGQLKKKLHKRVKVSISAYTPGSSKKYWERWKDLTNRRENRLKRIATKMRKLSMSENDIECMLRGGYKKGESFFDNPKRKKR